MTFASPLPSIIVPTLPLTPYVLEHAGRTGRQGGVHRRDHGPHDDLRRARRRRAPSSRRLARAPGWPRARWSRSWRRTAPSTRVVFHAVAMAGGVVTTVNPTYTPGEVHHQLVDAGATRARDDPDVPRDGHGGDRGHRRSTEVYVIGDADGYASIADLVGEPLAEQVPVDLDDVVVLPYSSGTTGLSKGVMLTHRNLVANIAQSTRPRSTMDEDDAFVAVLPFFHIYGMQVLMNLGPARRRHDRHDAAVRPRAVPVAAPGARAHPRASSRRRWSSPWPSIPSSTTTTCPRCEWIFSGAAPLSAELAIECGTRLGCEVVQGYGMTELSPVSHVTPRGHVQARLGRRHRPEHRGPHRRSRPTESPLGIDHDGEVWVRGPQVMKGYLNNDAATNEHDRRRRLAAHRRHRPRRRRRPPLRRRPAQGAHQVQGLPGAAGRARGAAAHPSRRSPTPP